MLTSKLNKSWIIHSELRANIKLLKNNLIVGLFTANGQNVRLLM